MSLLTGFTAFDAIAIFSTLLVGIILALKWHLGYWNRIGLPTLSPTVLYGDGKNFILGRQTFGGHFRDLYRAFKSKGHKHGGVFMGPKAMYLPTDPEIIKHIMQKDFAHFMNHGNYFNEEVDPLSGHLFSLENAKWRNLRVKLTPTFTSGKLKMMFQTLADCAVGLKDIMDEAATKHSPVDIKETLARFTTDVIGSAAFGLECNSLKDPNAEFRKYGRKIFELRLIDRMKAILTLSLPHSLLRALKLKVIKSDVSSFFMKVVQDNVNYREKNHVYRKDFMHLLLQLKNRGTVTDDEKITDEHGNTGEVALTINELAAQAFVFFLAGFETSSTLMTFALYEIAAHPEVQEKLRKEINTVLEEHGQLSYDAVMKMTYMDKVLNESLRKYPPVPVLTRKCNKEYTIPKTNIKIEEGVTVAIPILGLHMDSEYYPDPEKFDPDRFNEENKHSRPDFTWLPFGEGPRLCIGLRFGLMQSKVGLTTLLRNYKITLNQRTKVPLELDKRSFISSADGGVWLDVAKLE